ncbi:P-loop containing nucleoside triphosphate hydrolase protein [Terfezia boudieri ATCC MYA-4762]|uniref:ATP-dependent RNA helicase n=1 Tax=Terfezia boudieri ATCC MYA-4762 TaxID=1051890 RepID=A0A3N4LY93_9PEZI|nr:P-loop containing nucleoside triphosphate hydrolase protein [Terfezia boudieri ATCC MYA-4762]
MAGVDGGVKLKKEKKKRKSTSDAGTEPEQAPDYAKRRKPSLSRDKAAVEISTSTETFVAPAISRNDNANKELAKHPSILKKFQALLQSKPATPSTEPVATPEQSNFSVELQPQGLQPLPQPVNPRRTKPQISLDSTLPPWLSAPTIVPLDHSIPFSNLPLSEKLQRRIANHLKFQRAFAVQASILPLLLACSTNPDFHLYHDVLVSAPTGSGKTLSYILPVVQDISQRHVTRLRALVIVPTRELVSQVRDTTESLASGLKVGIAWGARSLDFERTLLIKDNWGDDPGRPDAFDVQFGEGGRYSSKVDILICTPGRLVEHLTTTPGFHLRDLRWMVIDEADRLLAQSFQEWLDAVMKALQTETSSFESRTQQYEHALGIRRNNHSRVRKVILSATMTKDAGKLAGLKLRKPKLVVIEQATSEEIGGDEDMADDAELEAGEAEEGDEDEKPDEIFSVPASLSEHYISVGEIEDKPLYLVQLLQTQGIKSGVLIFTKSNESAARLSRLMDLMVEGLKIGLVSGELNKDKRKKTLAKFKKNELDVLVCSDLISRGMDLPAVDHVINYDVSSATRSYVHRVGRTARAGNEGDAWSLVAKAEARWFWRNIGKGIKRGTKTIERLQMEFEADEAARERYESALRKLGEEVKGVGRR